jgi:glycerol-3-phosphate dehydrogenase
MIEFSWRTRQESLDKVSTEAFDLLIIGGGITGAGTALDAALRGLRVALVEKRDFAAGTSSRSTKLIHGGLRYLEHFDFRLVREGLHERFILAKIAPQLVRPFPFVIPIYQDLQRNYDHPLKIRAGLLFYDLLAGGYRFEKHRRLSNDQALKLAPQLDPHGLTGAFLYYDALTDDSRLVIEVIKSAHQRRASLMNYACVTDFIKGKDGKIIGAQLRDELTGRTIEVRARVIINATGVWTEDTIKLNKGDGDYLTKRVRPSKGIHLTVSADRLRVESAWLIPSLSERRFYFVVPWNGRVNIGTTDTDYEGDKDSPKAEAGEVSEILAAINSYFSGAQLAPSDVISSWAGLRPLISDPNARETAEISRKEELFETSDGLISISGGKLTTYRRMAERAVDLTVTRLSERFGIRAGAARTDEVAINGGAMLRKELEKAVQHIVENEKLSFQTAEHLVFTYGSNYGRLLEIMSEDERLREPLVEGLPQLYAEVVHAVRHEMAVTPADVLARRTRLAVLAGDGSLKCAPVAAYWMAKELGWDDQEMKRQIVIFASEYHREYKTPHP